MKECNKGSENSAQAVGSENSNKAAVLKRMVDHEDEVIHKFLIFKMSLSFNIS